MNLQKGKKICDELGVTPAYLAKLCHERKIKAYNCQSGKHILASTECLTALEYPESSVLCFKANGKNIGISEKFIREGKVTFKSDGINTEAFHSYEYEGVKYLYYLEKEITESSNIQRGIYSFEDEIMKENSQPENFIQPSQVESLKKNVYDSPRVKNLPMAFENEGQFTMDYIEFDLKIADNEKFISNVKKLCTNVNTTKIWSDTQIKFIIDNYDPEILKIDGYTRSKSNNKDKFGFKKLPVVSDEEMKRNLLAAYKRLNVSSKIFASKSGKKINICEDFFIFNFEEFEKYIYEKNLHLEFEYFYDYIHDLCFDINEINTELIKQNYEKEIKKDLKMFILNRYSEVIDRLEIESKNLKSTQDSKKNIVNKHKTDENKKKICFITAYIDVARGKTYKEVCKNISKYFDKIDMTDSDISKKFNEEFPIIAKKFDIPFIMPVKLRAGNITEDSIKIALKHYGFLDADKNN